MRCTRLFAGSFVVCLLMTPFSPAQVRQAPSRFANQMKLLPGAPAGVKTVAPEALPADAALREGWMTFLAGHPGWRAWLDLRSGVPALAAGAGIRWLEPGARATAASLEPIARSFLREHRELLGDWDDLLELEPAATIPISDRLFKLTFRQVVDGVPVDGARFEFDVEDGALIAFGARQWARVRSPRRAVIGPEEAKEAIAVYLNLPGASALVDRTAPTLLLIATDPAQLRGQNWTGRLAEGYEHVLVWRLRFAVGGEAGEWSAAVDAATGSVLSFRDELLYDQVTGGIFPIARDEVCPDGCEQPGFPMPWADVTETSQPVTYANDEGLYACQSPGASAATTLTGAYVRITDVCGAVSESAACGEDIDLGTGTGEDCSVPAGHSTGDTHAARNAFYHLNRMAETGRGWLPTNTWLQSQVGAKVNDTSACNAYWSSSAGVVFFRASAERACRNAGEIPGVVYHEWGHGLDYNDGGGYDSPVEGYADAVALLATRRSCQGQGFWVSSNCTGYGDACLNCTGTREDDYAQHLSGSPADGSWVRTYCPLTGDSPCSGSTHCEGHITAQTIWDLAVRDLPAMGLDEDSAWQLAEKLFYTSRPGTGGNEYNCASFATDGCGVMTWFHQFRAADDDDANLANGTPHAAAIYNAFARHGIACGAATDLSNRNSGTCAVVGKPDVSASPTGDQVQLSWPAVPGAASFIVLRNDLGCNHSSPIIGVVTAPEVSFIDEGAPAGRTLYYRVQARAANTACDGPVSDCVAAGVQRTAGTVRFTRVSYGCSVPLTLEVVDGNVGSSTVQVTVSSTTETSAETVALGETAPGSGRFTGSISSTSAPPQSGDGLLSVADGDALTVRYVDADDGAGGHNLERTASARADCLPPVITNVRDTLPAATAAVIEWTTNKAGDSILHWGATAPPAQQGAGALHTTSHSVSLNSLAPCTTYYYAVQTTDEAGNVALATNGGRYYRFETLQTDGRACHQGRLTLNATRYACAATVQIQLDDPGLNTDPGLAETIQVEAVSTSEPNPELLALTETGPDSGTFTGSVGLAAGAPAPDGVVQAANGDLITVACRDQDDGSGEMRVISATATADCSGPLITGLFVDQLTHTGARFRFTTDEPGSTEVEWGPTPSLGNIESRTDLVISHALDVRRSDICQTVYFRVKSTDAYGNTRIADRNGSPFVLKTWSVPGLYWRETFEGDTSGWVLDGEWQIGAPQGQGTCPWGWTDPVGAYAGAKALGQDLTGLGAHPGNYEIGTIEAATSPARTASAWTHTRLLYTAQFTQWDGAVFATYVVVNGYPMWVSSIMGRFGEAPWTTHGTDVSTYVDRRPSVSVRFEQDASTGDGTAPGWTIDEVIFKNGLLPDEAACGGCTLAPSFAGVTSAVDNDPCGGGGVTVSWGPAPAWGAGHTGTYSVYRGTTAGFPIDDAHRIAIGLTTLSHLDSAAPAGQLYYLVQAENDETCSTGPRNHGVVDDNLVYAPVMQTTSQPTPGAVGDLAVTRPSATNVRLSWTAAPNAPSYRVHRSEAPQSAGAFAHLIDTSSLAADDSGAAGDEATYFYFVRAANACGTEGP